ncbi:unnamed protein product, partial [Brenthis ino]
MSVPEDESLSDAIERTSENDVEVQVHNGTRHAFFREMDVGATLGGAGSRRVFGGTSSELKEFPTVSALLDRYLTVRCTATILNKHWVLTAAHCVTPRLAYKVKQEDIGRGLDVQTLHHDVGLVRTKDEIKLPALKLGLSAWRRNNALDLYNKDIKVFGFGRTERSVLGEELFSVDLTLVPCEQSDWLYCVCGVAKSDSPRGVCSGDSGGPILYEGQPVGVTSMGPTVCAHGSKTPPVGSTSVFTSLYQYSDIINATIEDTESAMRMRIISQATIFSPYQILLTVSLILPAR